MGERVALREAIPVTGKSLRTLQMWARQGKIPSAVRLAGGTWTVDLAKVRRWVTHEEGKSCQISTGGGKHGTPEFRLMDETVDEAYERFLGPKRKKG